MKYKALYSLCKTKTFFLNELDSSSFSYKQAESQCGDPDQCEISTFYEI